VLQQQGVIAWPYRVIAFPIWLQFVVVMVLLHTSVKRLEDDMCSRAFKKQSASVEVQLLASLFIAMKLDAALSWSWAGTLWPLWALVGVLFIVAGALTCFLGCMVNNVFHDASHRSNFDLALPSVMMIFWMSSIYLSIQSFLFLMRLSQYLDAQSLDDDVEVPSFDQHLTYLVGFLAFLEAYVALFGHAALRRVAQQHQQHQFSLQTAAATGQSAAEAEAQSQAYTLNPNP